MKDENQIAFSILSQALLTPAIPGEPHGARSKRALGMLHGARGGALSAALVPVAQRRENGLRGAIARWGSIRERDNSAMPASRKNLDMNQLAKRILDEATGDEPKTEPPPAKSAAAVELGKLGGKKGGAARAAALTSEQRSAIAKKAAAARWKKD